MQKQISEALSTSAQSITHYADKIYSIKMSSMEETISAASHRVYSSINKHDSIEIPKDMAAKDFVELRKSSVQRTSSTSSDVQVNADTNFVNYSGFYCFCTINRRSPC